MAFTVMMQSGIALQYKAFIKESDGYFEQIEEISEKIEVGEADKARVKMMLKIILDKHDYLTDSYLLNASIVAEAKKRQTKAKEIYARVFTDEKK